MELKLNLGAGQNRAEGYVNLDRENGEEAYPLPYPDNHFSEVRASHLLEHFKRKLVVPVLREWVRVLKPGGSLKIAVPNRDWIFTHWHDDAFLAEQYLFGGQADDNDFHKLSFGPRMLDALLAHVGLTNIQPWTDQVGDTHRLPVSLNLKGEKPVVDNIPKNPAPTGQIIAVMSCPRLGWTDHFGCVYEALMPLGIPIMRHSGVFWGQGLTKLIEDAIEVHKAEFIVTLDYDSIFSRAQVQRLCQLIVENDDVDAIVPVQVRRENDYSMFRIQDENGKGLSKVPKSMFERPLTKIAYGHFGLTILRVSAIKKLTRPWFLAVPDGNGEWKEGHIDEDIYFWQNAERVGWEVRLANEVRIGHLQNMIAWPKADFAPLHQYFGDWHEHGQPEEAGGDLEVIERTENVLD